MYFKLSDIDRGVCEALRLAAVAAGYMPDALVHDTPPAYEAALQAIRNAGKQPVNLYPVGSWRENEEVKWNTIIIRRTRRALSNIGYGGHVYYEPSPTAGKFLEKRTPYETAALTYTVTFVCENAANEEVLQGIMYDALDVSKALYALDESGAQSEDMFYIHRTDAIDQSDADFMEWIYTFEVSPVVLEADKTISEVSQIITIQQNTDYE
jgi:hypothetical protein